MSKTEIISVNDWRKMQAEGKVQSYPIKQRSTKQRDRALRDFDLTMKLAAIEYEEEYPFAPGRKFRFDRAIIRFKIGIEWEGISGKSRHTTITGYTKDTEKYNLAQSLGWTVLRYTVLNSHQMIDDVRKITGLKLK